MHKIYTTYQWFAWFIISIRCTFYCIWFEQIVLFSICKNTIFPFDSQITTTQIFYDVVYQRLRFSINSDVLYLLFIIGTKKNIEKDEMHSHNWQENTLIYRFLSRRWLICIVSDAYYGRQIPRESHEKQILLFCSLGIFF